jgi:hypothetical protein
VIRKNEAIAFVTAKPIAPCSGAAECTWNPTSANVETVISSKKTNMLKRSPLSAKPHIAPRKLSIRTWKSVPTSSKYRHA